MSQEEIAEKLSDSLADVDNVVVDLVSSKYNYAQEVYDE